MDIQLPPQQMPPMSSPESRTWFTKPKIVLLLTTVLIAAGILYYYFSLSGSFKTLTTLSYDAQKAIQLLNDPQTIVITKGEEVLLSDLKSDKLLLVPQAANLGQKIANLKMSKSRKYIAWQSEVGILGINVAKRTVFLISKDAPRQAFDVSPISDNILFVTKDQLLEIDLSNGRVAKRLSLPKIENPAAHFNHAKYNSNGTLAYIRSIHELPKENVAGIAEDAIVDLKTGQVSFLAPEFSDSVSLAPVWSADSSKLLAWRPQKGLITYSLKDAATETLIGLNDFSLLGPYVLSPDGKTILYSVKKDQIKIPGDLPARRVFVNTHIFLYNQIDQSQTPLINEKQLQAQGITGFISDIGWLGNDQVWLMVAQRRLIRQLWTMDRSGSNLKKIIEDFDQYSLESTKTPVTEAYTLYER